MEITASTAFIALAALLNSIEMSSCTSPKTRDFLANFGISNEEEDQEGGIPELHSHAESSLRARSRSPEHARHTATPMTIYSSNGTEYALDQLQFIRLTSYINPNRLLELRRYTFPSDKPIRLLTKKKLYVSVPTRKQIVLSSTVGDVFAILESSRVFAGLYAYDPHTHHTVRAKINMESRMVTVLTSAELKETPVGSLRQIPLCYRVERVNPIVSTIESGTR